MANVIDFGVTWVTRVTLVNWVTRISTANSVSWVTMGDKGY